MIKYTIDMKLYDEFGPDFLNAIEDYICVELYNTMNDKDVLDLHIINWNLPLNLGLYRHSLHKIIPNLIKRLKNGLSDTEKNSILFQEE
jgi:hypothetical protein